MCEAAPFQVERNSYFRPYAPNNVGLAGGHNVVEGRAVCNPTTGFTPQKVYAIYRSRCHVALCVHLFG